MLIICQSIPPQVYKEVVSLKKKNPSLEVLIRVEGNWTTLTHDPLAVAV